MFFAAGMRAFAKATIDSLKSVAVIFTLRANAERNRRVTIPLPHASSSTRAADAGMRAARSAAYGSKKAGPR